MWVINILLGNQFVAAFGAPCAGTVPAAKITVHKGRAHCSSRHLKYSSRLVKTHWLARPQHLALVHRISWQAGQLVDEFLLQVCDVTIWVENSFLTKLS